MPRAWPPAVLLACLLGAPLVHPGSDPAAELADTREQQYPELISLPRGQGRWETFLYCRGCHSVKLVAQQRMTRDSWDETLEWMVEEQAMPALEQETRRIVLDYLTTELGYTP